MGKKLNRNLPQNIRTPTDTATSWTKVKNYLLLLGHPNKQLQATGQMPSGLCTAWVNKAFS